MARPLNKNYGFPWMKCLNLEHRWSRHRLQLHVYRWSKLVTKEGQKSYSWLRCQIIGLKTIFESNIVESNIVCNSQYDLWIGLGGQFIVCPTNNNLIDWSKLNILYTAFPQLLLHNIKNKTKGRDTFNNRLEFITFSVLTEASCGIKLNYWNILCKDYRYPG